MHWGEAERAGLPLLHLPLPPKKMDQPPSDEAIERIIRMVPRGEEGRVFLLPRPSVL